MDGASDGKRTILHVIDALNVGGAQELLVLLADRTPKNEYKTLVCALQPEEALRSKIQSKGAPVYCLKRKRPSIFSFPAFVFYCYANIRDIRALCRRHRVDVVHCHLSDAEFLGIAAGWLCGVERIVSTVHYPALLPVREPGDIRNRLRVLATRLLYRFADAVIAVSADVAEELKSIFGLPASKLKVVVNGIDVNAIHDANQGALFRESVEAVPGQRLIASVGRLMPPKGHADLLEAMPHLIRRIDNVKLILAGDGNLRKPLEELSRRLGVDAAVAFLGSRSDVPEILAASEVFVLPSLSEGTSLALLEAMAAGKSIVATDIPGNRAVLKHQSNCLLVPPGSPEKLAEAIGFLLNNPRIADKYGENAYRKALRHFDIDQTVARLKEIWG